ncbi:precorrin-6y C5,15-methyltransferase (decarboxylating) subunit CbiE [Rhodospirillaceae bacterium SYSU D60014]|uniref:precorrin-6y C5,15-methyltransferase (decarboxylating) subunit CbiE n=1 Tax=Virgifigura deserti TaxID=2268457 RepID=UPI000E672178
MTRWLSIVGLDEGGLATLPALARELIDQAELLVGGARHLAMVPEGGAERMSWASPLKLTVEEILRWRGRRVVVLATGDPMWYGVGVTLARAVPLEEMLILPAPSAFSLACARLGWPLAETECLTLHGRPLALLNGAVAPGARLLLLSHDGTTPATVAKALVELGYGASRVVALEHMGGAAERHVAATAETWTAAQVGDLNTVAVECMAGPDAVIRPHTPGLSDEAFRHDGQLTKREIRAMTVAALAPLPGQRLWDIGAGCGSIAIEWLRCGRSLRAVAVERDAERVSMITENAVTLGVPQLQVVVGAAPAALADLPSPDAVFIGGGVTMPGLAERCWAALPCGGRLVVNVVTVEGEGRLIALRDEIGGTLTRLAVSRAEPVGPFSGWRPLMPVTQFAAVKP